MGNTAMVYDANNKRNYLHFSWNGGVESIKGILDYCRLQGWYEWKHFVIVSEMSLNTKGARVVSKYTEDPEYCNNGGYLIDPETMTIIDRIGCCNEKEEFSCSLSKREILKNIDENIPYTLSLSEQAIDTFINIEGEIDKTFFNITRYIEDFGINNIFNQDNMIADIYFVISKDGKRIIGESFKLHARGIDVIEPLEKLIEKFDDGSLSIKKEENPSIDISMSENFTILNSIILNMIKKNFIAR